jgi:hypothetical protein
LEIRVNDQPVDFTLEGERTLGEVVRGLERWLAGTPLVLYSVLHGGRELLNLPLGEWAATPQAEVGRLEVTVRHNEELAAENLITASEFLAMARTFVSGSADPALTEELARGLPHLAESLRRHFPAQEVEQGLAGLAALLSEAQPGAGGGESRRETGLRLESLQNRVALRFEELQDPRGALRRLAADLKPCIEQAAEVSLLLQTGRDREAMAAIMRFAEITQASIRLLEAAKPDAIDGRPPQEYFGELNRILKELIEAFGAKDTVLIGDLMEYEIAPRLRKLQAVLE